MPAMQAALTHTLYGEDVWADYTPQTPPDHQGWNGDHPSLGRLATIGDNPVIVDVGVWKGGSTINMALALKRGGIDGCVIAVDTFLGSAEHWDMGLFQRRHGQPDLLQRFMANVRDAGVSDYIVPLAQTSITAAAVLRNRGICPDLVHVDAAHEYEEVLRDAEEYYGLLKSGGYLIGDDYHQTWPGVVRAAAKFSFDKELALEIESPKWIVRKP